jgi:hypothetical protein
MGRPPTAERRNASIKNRLTIPTAPRAASRPRSAVPRTESPSCESLGWSASRAAPGTTSAQNHLRPEWAGHGAQPMAGFGVGLSGLERIQQPTYLGLRSSDSLQPRLSHCGPSALARQTGPRPPTAGIRNARIRIRLTIPIAQAPQARPRSAVPRTESPSCESLGWSASRAGPGTRPHKIIPALNGRDMGRNRWRDLVSAFQALRGFNNQSTWACPRPTRSSPGCHMAGLRPSPVRRNTPADG